MKKNINTDNMTTFELDALLSELKQIRRRKQKLESFAAQMEELLQLAADEDISFVSLTIGMVIKPGTVTAFDELHRYDD